MTATATKSKAQTREEILKEINDLECRIIVLRDSLPTRLDKFYRFRTKPGQFCLVYASSRDDAQQKVIDRMNADYGDAWKFANQAVDVYETPEQAAACSPGNLFRSLRKEDAERFARDFRAELKAKGKDKRQRGEPISQVERDLENWQISQQMRKTG